MSVDHRQELIKALQEYMHKPDTLAIFLAVDGIKHPKIAPMILRYAKSLYPEQFIGIDTVEQSAMDLNSNEKALWDILVKQKVYIQLGDILRQMPQSSMSENSLASSLIPRLRSKVKAHGFNIEYKRFKGYRLIKENV